MARKSNASKFIDDINNYLLNSLNKNTTKEYRLGNDIWCSKADLFLADKKNKIFIEVDEGQPHPDTNVLKYWYWMETENIKSKVLLIHVFGSYFYNNNYRSRSQLCRFLVDKMKVQFDNFEYIPVPRDVQHSYDENWTLSSLADETKEILKKRLK